MQNIFLKPIKSHIADVYDTERKIVIYDADSIDTRTNIFKTLYLIYGTLDNVTDLDIKQLQSVGCKNPELYNPDAYGIIEID